MTIPFYILGLLQRYGPQHGYQIKKIISEQLSDFTQIKLPAIYYHLEKMAGAGLLQTDFEKDGSRPEKTVYSVTGAGREKFLALFEELLNFNYRPTFAADGVFYFSEYSDPGCVVERLRAYIVKLHNSIHTIEKHMEETLVFIPPENQSAAGIIFNHHIAHFRAECEWAENAVSIMEKEKENGTGKNP